MPWVKCSAGWYSMDDVIRWTDDRATGHAILAAARAFLGETLRLTVKDPVRGGSSRQGIVFCGYRVRGHRLLLTRRRKRRYHQLRRDAEAAWHDGRIGFPGLRSVYASALGLTPHEESQSWRREELRRHPVAAALDAA